MNSPFLYLEEIRRMCGEPEKVGGMTVVDELETSIR